VKKRDRLRILETGQRVWRGKKGRKMEEEKDDLDPHGFK